MQSTLKVIPAALILMVIASAIGCNNSQPENKSASKKVTFICTENKFIEASFNKQSVELKLSDSRNLTLSQAVSGSGARYVNKDESVVFWNKGNTAFITENDSKTYNNCVVEGEDDLVNLETYQSTDDAVAFRYPKVLQLVREAVNDTSGWSYESVQKGEMMVQLKLDESVQPQTNLSEATFTVGRSADAKALENCKQSPQTAIIKTDSVQKNGITFVRSKYSDAGAGNFYEIIQFRGLHQNTCYSIEEMVHSTNIHNYPAERGISELDSARVWKALNVGWQTFRFGNKK